MAKRNQYSFSKRQRELKKKKKQEEKRARKRAKAAGELPEEEALEVSSFLTGEEGEAPPPDASEE